MSKTSDRSSNKITDEKAKRIIEWMASAEGVAQLQEVLEKARECVKKLAAERVLDSKSLNEPFTL